jgi:signal transduction histidine kinase
VGAADRETLETLARQAAVTIHNARLAADLTQSLDEIRLQAEELAASRSRIVAAEASARRQIERDIHDGAQQELVGLIAKIGLARNRLGPNANGLSSTLEELQAEARDALTNLRQLASGIHPTELSDHGLVEAIEGRSARLSMGVTIDCAPELRTARFPEAVEGAAYFFVSEALANTLKHAGAQTACIRLACAAGRLQIEVVDDGVGFEAQGCSTPGLRGLADRMEALGGAVAVESAPGHGTTLSASLPIGGHRG